MKWVRKVFKDVSQPSVDADPLPLGDGDALWSDRLGDLITDDPVDGDERLWDRHLDGVVPGIATVSGGSSSRTPGGGGHTFQKHVKMDQIDYQEHVLGE